MKLGDELRKLHLVKQWQACYWQVLWIGNDYKKELTFRGMQEVSCLSNYGFADTPPLSHLLCQPSTDDLSQTISQRTHNRFLDCPLFLGTQLILALTELRRLFLVDRVVAEWFCLADIQTACTLVSAERDRSTTSNISLDSGNPETPFSAFYPSIYSGMGKSQTITSCHLSVWQSYRCRPSSSDKLPPACH
jgi:hypothetical protein